MTLLASERSLLIRNKFRSVLQLRIQNRRQSEINADVGLKSACCPKKAEKDQSEALRLSDGGAAQKLPPCGLNTKTAQERNACGAQRHKKARQTQDLTERIPRPPGPVEQQPKHTLPLQNRCASFPLSADVFEDDISSCPSPSPTEQHGVHQSPAFTPLPGLSGDQSLSDFSAVGPSLNHSTGHAQSGLAFLPATEGIRQPMSVTLSESNSMATTGRPNGMYLTSQTTPLLPKTARPHSPTCSSSLPSSLNFNHLPRPRKPRDTKPKMRKLKYHQYIPPDQRGGSGTGGAKQKSPPQSLDPAYSHLLKQQQVFLQLQIHQNQQQLQQQQLQQQQLQPQQQQQQLTVVPIGEQTDLVKSCGATPPNPQRVPATTNHKPTDTNPASKPELLPANLVDLTVSELRQQLRKRGLPVSGTKPALLQRLRPFQLPHSCLTPAPLCQRGTSLELLTSCPPLPPSQSPCSSSSSGRDSPSSSPNQQMYIPDRGVPNGILSDSQNEILNSVTNGFSNAAPVSLAGEHCLSNAVFLAPASTASGTPSPSLPMSSSSPLQCGTPWRTENEQQQQQQQELSVELEMRERLRSRPREHCANAGNESCGGSLHPFLQQDPGCSRRKPETDTQAEVLFTQVFCCQPCDMIGQDFELPVQITASPVQTLSCVRSLEEELQEAIQKAQMDPRQSIDDILDEPMTCVGSVNVCDHKSPAHLVPGPSQPPPPPPPPPPPLPPPSQADQSQASQLHKDDSFLPSPLCSSLLLELPPSPAVINPSHVIPAPPPPSICTSPLPSTGKSRKRRAPTSFDAADWLETLTSGLRPLTPPAAPFVESDFSLDSDLNVSRVLDLMIEKW
ncbi:myocardin [Pseudoliparis swirei]|uniref:myocardin n=1 Tax=Pseudoliparis swirei TaxID=2059687 RepID=UPI0024BE4DCF|nr:myocardin [Pseudoliparis swirei]